MLFCTDKKKTFISIRHLVKYDGVVNAVLPMHSGTSCILHGALIGAAWDCLYGYNMCSVDFRITTIEELFIATLLLTDTVLKTISVFSFIYDAWAHDVSWKERLSSERDFIRCGI